MVLIAVPANIYLFKVNNRNTIKRYKIHSKFTIKNSERYRVYFLNKVLSLRSVTYEKENPYHSGVFISTLNIFQYIFKYFFSTYIVNFKQINMCWSTFEVTFYIIVQSLFPHLQDKGLGKQISSKITTVLIKKEHSIKDNLLPSLSRISPTANE